MANASFLQTSFLGGRWSNTAQGRAEQPDYRAAMAECLNGLPIEEGAWTRRPGTLQGGYTNGGQQAKLLPYAFNQADPFILEFTSGTMRAWQGTQIVTQYANQRVVTAVTTANPAVITMSSSSDLSTGTVFYFSSDGGNAIIAKRLLVATHTSGNSYSIADAITGTTIDGSQIVNTAGLTIAPIWSITSPYISTDFMSTRLVQCDGAAILLQGQYFPQVVSPAPFNPPVGPSGPNDTSQLEFLLNPANFIDGPYLDPFTNGAEVTPSATSGSINLTLAFPTYSASQPYKVGDYVVSSSITYVSLQDPNLGNTPASSPTFWQAVNPATAVSPNGFTAANIGQHIRLYSEPALWVVGTNYTAGNVVKFAGAYYTCLVNNTATLQNAPLASVTDWAINPTGATWTWGKITGLLSQSVGTGTPVGDMTSNGGLSAAFDGVLNKDQAASATGKHTSSFTSGQSITFKNSVGLNLSSTKVTSTTVYPTSDEGLVQVKAPSVLGMSTKIGVVALLYAANSSLSDPTTGTLCGQTVVSPTTNYNIAPGNSQIIGTSPVTISNTLASSTSFTYYWIVFETTVQNLNSISISNVGINQQTAQVQLFVPGGSSVGVVIEVLGPPLLYTVPIVTWQLGLYGPASNNYPTCGCYHEGRLWLAGSVKNRVDASQPNQPWTGQINFGPTDLDIGTVEDSNAISYVLNANDVNTILWMKSDAQGIIIGTEKREWLMQSTTANDPITPTNIQAHPVTRIGSALSTTAEPVQCEHASVFIQRYQRKLMEYFGDVFSGKLVSFNIALKAQDLTAPMLDTIAYQQSLTPVIWARREDGVLVGCSYKREGLFSTQPPTFVGWHQHALGSERLVTNIVVGPSTDGTSDTLALVTRDGSNLYYVEFLTNIFQEADTSLNAWFVDSGIQPYYAIITINGVQNLWLLGLWGLEGGEVDVYAGGMDLGTYNVSGGQVFIPFTSNLGNGQFTTSYVNSFINAVNTVIFPQTPGYMPIVVGYSYTSQGQLVRPVEPQETGARLGPATGKIRRVHRFAASLVNTFGISFGTLFSNLHAAILKTYPGNTILLNPGQLFTGIYRDNLQDDNSLDGQICWQITRPYPATVTSIAGSISTQDT